MELQPLAVDETGQLFTQPLGSITPAWAWNGKLKTCFAPALSRPLHASTSHDRTCSRPACRALYDFFVVACWHPGEFCLWSNQHLHRAPSAATCNLQGCACACAGHHLLDGGASFTCLLPFQTSWLGSCRCRSSINRPEQHQASAREHDEIASAGPAHAT